jgi:hypothetical protein
MSISSNINMLCKTVTGSSFEELNEEALKLRSNGEKGKFGKDTLECVYIIYHKISEATKEIARTRNKFLARDIITFDSAQHDLVNVLNKIYEVYNRLVFSKLPIDAYIEIFRLLKHQDLGRIAQIAKEFPVIAEGIWENKCKTELRLGQPTNGKFSESYRLNEFRLFYSDKPTLFGRNSVNGGKVSFRVNLEHKRAKGHHLKSIVMEHLSSLGLVEQEEVEDKKLGSSRVKLSCKSMKMNDIKITLYYNDKKIKNNTSLTSLKLEGDQDLQIEEGQDLLIKKEKDLQIIFHKNQKSPPHFCTKNSL